MDRALAADAARREAIATFEAKRAEQKKLGKLIPQAQGEEKQALLAQTKTLAAEVKEAEAAQATAEQEWHDALWSIPNLAADEAPAGGEDDFTRARDGRHARGSSTSSRATTSSSAGSSAPSTSSAAPRCPGSRFYFLTGVGAELEFALINLANEHAREHGFTQVIAPSMVKPRAMDGTGFLGQAADDVYRIEGQDIYLVGTSEVPMAAYHSDEILDAAALPLRYAAFSPCFRKEAGSHGKDTKGIIRVHWFDKVEMFVYTTLEDSYAEHQRLLEIEKEFLDKLELAYQVIDTAAGDLGLSAQRKFDCEAWIPTQGRYRELTSTSNCTDFQTRRLDIRGRFPDGVGPVATLNGTLCAMTRTIVAILETHQQADGSVRVPKALQPWLGPRRRWSPCRGDIGRLAAQGGRPRHRRHPAQVGGGRRVDLRADRAAHSRRRPRGPRCRRPRRAGVGPLAARHDRDRRPARPARPGRGAGVGGGEQRRRGVPLPAGRGRPRGDVRRRAGRPGDPGAGTPPRWWRSRSAASATALNSPFPEGELSGDMIITDVEDLVARPGQPGDHPRPRAERRRLRGARRASSACTAPTTSSAGPPGSTSPRSASPRRPGSPTSSSSSG